MGLKELKSNLDLVQGEGPVSGMADISVPNFQLGTEAASQKHIDSLQQVPGGDSSSPFQDYDGATPPLFQQSTDVASQAHISSLSAVPAQEGGFADRNNGATPTQYLDNMPN